MDKRPRLTLEAYFSEMRTLVRISEAPSIRMLRRRWLLPRLRQYVAAKRRRPARTSESHFGEPS